MKKKNLMFTALALICAMILPLSACTDPDQPGTKEPNTAQPATSAGGGQEYAFTELDLRESEVWDTANYSDTIKQIELQTMYTTQTNRDGDFDISTISTEEPEAAYSQVLAIEAPEDGCYTFEISYTVGGEEGVGDGVTLSIYADDVLQCKHTVSNGISQADEREVQASLKQGEYLYIIADPNESSEGDVFSGAHVYMTRDIPYAVDNETSWAFGKGYNNAPSGESDSWQEMAQGTNGWYLSAAADSKPGVLPEDSDSIIKFEQMGLMFGFNNQGSAKTLYWQAPESGKYYVEVKPAAIKSDGDGMTISYWDGENKIAEIDSSEQTAGLYSMEISFDKGDLFSMMMDTNENTDGDIIQGMNVYIRKMS